MQIISIFCFQCKVDSNLGGSMLQMQSDTMLLQFMCPISRSYVIYEYECIQFLKITGYMILVTLLHEGRILQVNSHIFCVSCNTDIERLIPNLFFVPLVSTFHSSLAVFYTDDYQHFYIHSATSRHRTWDISIHSAINIHLYPLPCFKSY